MHDIVEANDIDPDYDIDIAVDTVLANVAAHTSSGTCIPPSKWQELSSEARELWQSLLATDRAIILGASTNSGSASVPRSSRPNSAGQCQPACSTSNPHLSSYLSKVAIKDKDPDPVPLAHNDPPDTPPAEPDTVLLANVTKQKRTWMQPHGSDLPPSDIRKVLSNDNTHAGTSSPTTSPKELVVDGTRYRAVNMARFYTVSSTHRTMASGSLIDCGANGGLAGVHH